MPPVFDGPGIDAVCNLAGLSAASPATACAAPIFTVNILELWGGVLSFSTHCADAPGAYLQAFSESRELARSLNKFFEPTAYDRGPYSDTMTDVIAAQTHLLLHSFDC